MFKYSDIIAFLYLIYFYNFFKKNLISSFDLQSVKLFHRSKGVADGKIIGFALRKQLFRHRRVNYAMFYEIFETFAFGKVTGVSRIRDMRLHDAWSFVMRKGKTHH